MNANMLIEIREETLYELYEEGGGDVKTRKGKQ